MSTTFLKHKRVSLWSSHLGSLFVTHCGVLPVPVVPSLPRFRGSSICVTWWPVSRSSTESSKTLSQSILEKGLIYHVDSESYVPLTQVGVSIRSLCSTWSWVQGTESRVPRTVSWDLILVPSSTLLRPSHVLHSPSAYTTECGH